MKSNLFYHLLVEIQIWVPQHHSPFFSKTHTIALNSWRPHCKVPFDLFSILNWIAVLSETRFLGNLQVLSFTNGCPLQFLPSPGLQDILMLCSADSLLPAEFWSLEFAAAAAASRTGIASGTSHNNIGILLSDFVLLFSEKPFKVVLQINFILLFHVERLTRKFQNLWFQDSNLRTACSARTDHNTWTQNQITILRNSKSPINYKNLFHVEQIKTYYLKMPQLKKLSNFMFHVETLYRRKLLK